MSLQSIDPVTASLIIVGNEILSGRTQDTNLNHLAKRLGDLGIRLVEVRVIPDIASVIQATVNELRSRCRYVFTTGGIGPTHDDITAENIAAAFKLPLIVHPAAKALLAEYYASRDLPFNEARMRMARTPEGATLIDNPVSIAPGFRIENVFVLAGVPKIMQAMLENILPDLERGIVIKNRSIECQLPEGLLAEPLAKVQDAFPELDLGSYPGKSFDNFKVSIVIRGEDQVRVDQAAEQIEKMVNDLS